MGLANLLAQVSSAGSDQKAWDDLYKELRSLLVGSAFARGMQADEFDDLLQMMVEKMLSMLSRGPFPVAGKSDGECHEYLRKMFRNLSIANGRKGQRETTVESPPEVEVQPTAEGLLEVKRRGELVERVYAAYHQTRRKDHLEALEQDWAELRGLMSGELDMARLLLERENVGSDASPGRKASAADLVYKRHSRLRDNLAITARKLRDQGLLSQEELEQAVELFELMKRSQQKGGKS